MIRIASVVCVALVVSFAGVAQAEDASTGDLPAALQALGATNAVVSADEAHQVRGQTGTFGTLIQDKSFSVSGGTAVGTTNLLEGVFGAFNLTVVDNVDMSTLVVEGSFGGLAGSIGGDSSGLNFQIGGKALQESLDFTGKFQQDFSQSFSFGF